MGCLKSIVVRVVTTLIFLALIVIAILYHREILDYIDAWRGRSSQTYQPPQVGDASRPRDALQRLAEPGSPPYQDITGADLAALIDSALSKGGRKAFDSVQVALLENEVRVRGNLDISRVPRSILGPLSGMLRDREPVTIGGPLAVDSAGRLVITVSHLAVRDFPFPRSTIPRILAELRIPSVSGTSVAIPLGVRLGDVRVTPEHVRVYKAAP